MKKYSFEKFKENKKNKRMIKTTTIVLIAIVVLIFASLYILIFSEKRYLKKMLTV